jgi:hypothetical protein
VVSKYNWPGHEESSLRLPKVRIFLICLITCVVAGAARSQSAGSTTLQRFFGSEAGLSPLKSEQTQCTGGKKQRRVAVEIVRFRQDSEAYELLSKVAADARARHAGVEIQMGFGTAGFADEGELSFFRGPAFVQLKGGDLETLKDCADQLTGVLDKGEGDIPVLLKHLPNPNEALKNAIYLNSFTNLNALGLQQGVLSAIESGGNADAVLAAYGPSKVLIVEFNTPQLATDNDQRIIARIQELWKLGQPAPTAYRRVGNYSVFVFDAPDEQMAKQLIDQVKYEQVVQWLGENPNIFKEAEKRYINTTLGVLVAVLKASGYALIACLGLGGLFGGLLFSYRRAQQKDVAAYSDAGGMLRLNLDELTPETDPGRLLRERN